MSTSKDRGTEIAYALYVLARNKRASVGDLRYYADTKLEAFSSPMAVAQLAASLALYGEAQRAEATLSRRRSTLPRQQTRYDWNRSDYGSQAARRRRHAGACSRKQADCRRSCRR